MKSTNPSFNSILGFSKGGPAIPDRRDFLGLGLGLAAAWLLSGIPTDAQSQQVGQPARGGAAADKGQLTKTDRRKLGPLEVSSLGLGCMSMAGGFYDNPPPDRREMVALIRAAVERGVVLR